MIEKVRGMRVAPLPTAHGVAPKPAPSASGATMPQLLDLVSALAQAGPPVDAPRVAQLRRAIADGSYIVDPDAIARAIMVGGSPRG